MPTPAKLPDLPVRWVNIEDLAAATENPKLHDIETVKASIRRHGYVDYGVMDDRTDRLVGGHGRAEALVEMRDAGESPAEWPISVRGGFPGVVVLDDGWVVPTGYTTTADDNDASHLLVSLNSGDRPGWQTDGLADLLDRLDGDRVDLKGTGYNRDDVDKMLDQLENDRHDLPDPDEGSTDPELSTGVEFRVIVDCESEQQQGQLVERLEAEGFTARMLMS